MNKITRNGLGAIVGLAVAGLTLGSTEGCSGRKEVYDILNGQCRNTSCGEVCYNGVSSGMIHTKIDGKYIGFPIENSELNIEECKLPIVDVTDDLLVIKNWSD